MNGGQTLLGSNTHSTPVYEAFLRREYSDGTWRHLAALRCVYSDDSLSGLVSNSTIIMLNGAFSTILVISNYIDGTNTIGL